MLTMKGSAAVQFAVKICKRSHSVGIIGAPFSRGQRKDGVQKGPDLIRGAGLVDKLKGQGCAVKDYGNLKFEEVPDDHPAGLVKKPRTVGLANERLAQAIKVITKDGHASVMLGGDHSMAIGSIHGHASSRSSLSVVWVDAHADINTPLSSYTGNIHGQPLSYLIKELHAKVPVLPGFSWLRPCISAGDIIFIGLRDVDPAERFIIKLLGIKAFSMTDVDRLGIAKVMEETCDHIYSRGKKPVHLSYDIDALDPSVAPATGTPVVGGLTYREGIYITEAIHQTDLLSAVDLVEVNPNRGRTEDEVSSTTSAAVDVILGCFGRVRQGSYPSDYQLPNP